MEPTRISNIPYIFDPHAHFRQPPDMKHFIKAHLDMCCASVVTMPNPIPVVKYVFGPQQPDGRSIESYTQEIIDNGGDAFENIIVPLYLTADTTPEVILAGARAGVLKAVKYMPPSKPGQHSTTNAHAAAPFSLYIKNGVAAALEETQVSVSLHGEGHYLTDEEWMGPTDNAETRFYDPLNRYLDLFPKMRVCCEHISTKEAVLLVEQRDSNVVATVCPQHLLYIHPNMSRRMAVHLCCQPSVKWPADRLALRKAVTSSTTKLGYKFLAGTDSAPHHEKMKLVPIDCNSGCFTGGIAPQLYAMAFEAHGCDLANPATQETFIDFLVHRANTYYGLPTSPRTFTLEKVETPVEDLILPDGNKVIPLPRGMGQNTLPWRIVA